MKKGSFPLQVSSWEAQVQQREPLLMLSVVSSGLQIVLFLFNDQTIFTHFYCYKYFHCSFFIIDCRLGQKNDNGCVSCEIGTYQTMDYHRQGSCVSCEGTEVLNVMKYFNATDDTGTTQYYIMKKNKKYYPFSM